MTNKHYLPYPIFLFIFGTIVLGVWSFIRLYPPAPAPVGINAINTAGTVALSLLPNVAELALSSEQTITLSVNSGSDRLSIVKFNLNYDPNQLTISDLAKGTWLTQELISLSHQSGSITGEFAAKPNTSVADGGAELARTGTGSLLTFRVKAKKAGSHTINIDSANSFAWTITEYTPNHNNMLSSVSGTTLAFSSSPSPSASPSLSPSPSLKPSVKPTSTPKSSLQSSLHPTPSTSPSSMPTPSDPPKRKGLLSDIFKTSDASASASTDSINIFERIWLGWRAIIAKLASFF